MALKMFLDLRQQDACTHSQTHTESLAEKRQHGFECREKRVRSVRRVLFESEPDVFFTREAGQIRGRQASGQKIRRLELREELGEQQGRNVVERNEGAELQHLMTVEKKNN